MSATRFKVGDKVKVREGLVGGRYYDGIYCTSDMANSDDEVFTICSVGRNFYTVEGYDLRWSDEMLEPAEKTLDNLCAGDLVTLGYEKRMILAAVDGCYLLSYSRMYEAADRWCTAERLKIDGFEFFDPQSTAIEINGKKYNKADVEKAIKDLEPIDPSDTDS